MAIEVVGSGQATLPTPNSTASFWHSKPSKLLLGHRTTNHLPTKTDIAIIGSGITGSFAAHHLFSEEKSRGLNVVMLEAREACWGATGRNGGHCQPKIYTNPPHIARFELENFESIRNLITDNQIDCEWQDVKSCHGYTSMTLFDAEVSAVCVLRSLDSELGKMIQIVTSKSTDPSLTDLILGDDVVGAIVQNNSASLWPYKLIVWILERLLSNNPAEQVLQSNESGLFNLQTNTPATRLQRLKDGTWVVHTSRGMLAAKHIVLATNGYTSCLLPKFTDIITPVRGQMSALIPPSAVCSGDGKPLAGEHSYGFYGRGTGTGTSFNQDDYLIQRPFLGLERKKTGGELMFGGGRQYANAFGIGVSDDGDIDQPAASYLRRELFRVLDLSKDEQELCASYEWSGIMGYSKDGRPWVGQVPESLGGGQGLWICAGFTGHGMPNASLCAKAVTDSIMGKRVEDINLPVEFQVSAKRIEMAQMLVAPLLPGSTLNGLA